MMKVMGRLANSTYLWYVLIVFLVLFPFFLYGAPGYYGDDFNSFLAIDRFGLVGAIEHWIDQYSIGYRPIGIVILYSVYDIFRGSINLFYFISIAIYLSFVWIVYRECLRISMDPLLSIFVTVFFSLFPFNPTAYLQLSSIYMMVAGGISIFLIGKVVTNNRPNSNQYLLMFGLLWGGVLLIYEQVTGLVAVLVVLVWLVRVNVMSKTALRESIRVGIVFGVITLLFVLLYVFSPNNPKITTLKELNSSSAPSVVHDIPSAELIDKEIDIATIKTTGRLDSFQVRLIQAFNFLVDNVNYAWSSLQSTNVGWFLIPVLSLALLLVLYLRVIPPDRKIAFIYLLVGCLWFVSTISPFLLYQQVHIPPYTLLIPSIGVALALYGGFWFVLPGQATLVKVGVFKALLATVLVLFTLLQAGYYAGLNEELRYWEKISLKLEPMKNDLIAGHTVCLEDGLPEKFNAHIFWLEKAVGHRYLRVLMGDEYAKLDVMRHTNSDVVCFTDL